MINRLGSSNDNLGVNEFMRDQTTDNKGINVTAKFYLAFASDKKTAIQTIFKRHLLTQSPLHYFTVAYATLTDKITYMDSQSML